VTYAEIRQRVLAQLSPEMSRAEPPRLATHPGLHRSAPRRARGRRDAHRRPRRHLLPVSIYRREMRQRLRIWQGVTSVPSAA
jgi:hypothetical protein